MKLLRLLPLVLFCGAGMVTAQQRGVDPPRPVENASAVTAVVFDSLANAFSYYSMDLQSIQYDPTSNVLATIKRGWGNDLSNIYIRTSTDLGATWSAPIGPLSPDTATNGSGRYPGMVILNPSGTSDPMQLLYHFNIPVIYNGGFGRVVWGIIEANGGVISPPYPDDGITGTGGDRTWGTDNYTIVSNNGNVLVTLGAVSGNALAMRRYDIAQGAYTTTVPSQWETSNYYQNATDPTASYSSWAGGGRDGNNTYYAGSQSYWADVAMRGPRPGVSTSVDDGETWGDFAIMPTDVVDSYLNANAAGVIEDSTFFNYLAKFIVSGNGRCHFFLNYFETDAAKSANREETFAHVVEAEYSGGYWTLRKVSDVDGRYYILKQDASDTSRNNQMQTELSLSVTADGGTLLAKWVDLTAYIFQGDIDDDGDSPDTLGTSDVYVAARRLPDGDWSQRLNVTETPLLDRVTHIPERIPNDLSNVPMLATQTIVDNPSTLEDSIFTQQTFVGIPQHVVMENFDATSIAGVRDGRDLPAARFHLHNPVPNPARDRSLLMFQLQQPGEVRIEVVAADGRVVTVPCSTRYDAGNHGVVVDTKQIAVGSYTVVMSVNGVRTTRSLVVVH